MNALASSPSLRHASEGHPAGAGSWPPHRHGRDASRLSTGSARPSQKLPHAVLALTKWRIALLSAVAATAGMMLAAPDAGWRMAWPVLGTYLLACGAAALNQVQERKCDARMERTKHRPLPAGAMSVGTAAVIGVVLVAAGLGMLAVTGRVVTVALGVTAVLSYNALYTPLKRVTPWAPVIGAVVGAFAPAIGWTGVSGETFSPALVGLTVFFVVWQIPHFWLLFLRLEREFAAAGLPVLSARFGPDGLKRVTFVWTLASAALGLSLPLFGAVRHPGLVALLVGTALWLGWRVRGVLSDDEPRSLCRAFVAINAFAVVLLTTIILGKWN